MKKKILILAFDSPLPATNGGRKAILDTVKRLSIENTVFVCFWHHATDNVSVAETASVLENTAAFVKRPPISSLGRVRGLARIIASIISRDPYGAYLLRPTQSLRRLEQIGLSFQPDIVILEGLQTISLGIKLRKTVKAKYIYRRHNDEKEYYLGLAASSKSLIKRLHLYLNAHKAEKAEATGFRELDEIWEIAWIEGRYLCEKLRYVPPSVTFRGVGSEVTPIVDVTYASSWGVPNKRDGLISFLKVWRQADCPFSLAVAGADDNGEIAQVCSRNGVSFKGTVPSLPHFLATGRVCINPVWHGSGVNMKIVDFLAAERPLVSTQVGLKGWPPNAFSGVRIVHTADEMIGCVRELLKTRGGHFEISNGTFWSSL
jgi:hypothetical protein